jgi:hypothetical protein
MATSASSKEMETPGPVMVQFIRNGNPRSSYVPVPEKWKPQVQLWSSCRKMKTTGPVMVQFKKKMETTGPVMVQFKKMETQVQFWSNS